MPQRTLSTVLCTATVLVAAGGSAVDAANLQPLPAMMSALAQSDEDESQATAGDEAAEEEAVEEEATEEAPEEEAAEEVAEDAVEPEQEETASEDSGATEEDAPTEPEATDVAEEPAAPEPAPQPAAPPPPAAPQPGARAPRSWDDAEDNTTYKVVINHEEQYSIWPANRENALGWNDAGKTGSKQECLDYIEEVWTDMRPLSLRRKMEEMERQRGGD